MTCRTNTFRVAEP